jgi:UDP-glucose 4-epimerase
MYEAHDTGKILVTGSNGFIGGRLVSFLEEKGLDVLPVTREVCNLLDEDAVNDLFSNHIISAVIHCAARTGFREDSQSNDVFYENLLMYENLNRNLSNSCLFFNLGSGAEFDHSKEITMYKESDLGVRVPTDPYGFSKYIISKLIHGKTNQVNLRLFNVFGAEESDNRFVKSAITNLLKKEPIIVFDDKIMDFFFIEDLCTLILHYLKNYKTTLNPGLPRDLNVCYEEKNTLQEIANIINSFSSNRVPVWIRSYKKDKVNYCGDGKNLSNLCLPFLGLRVGLKKTYESTIK